MKYYVSYENLFGEWKEVWNLNPNIQKFHHREAGAGIRNDISEIYKWVSDDKLHRDNGPAVINKKSGSMEWWRKGKLHRDDGPAVVLADGHEEYWVNGERIFKKPT